MWCCQWESICEHSYNCPEDRRTQIFPKVFQNCQRQSRSDMREIIRVERSVMLHAREMGTEKLMRRSRPVMYHIHIHKEFHPFITYLNNDYVLLIQRLGRVLSRSHKKDIQLRNVLYLDTEWLKLQIPLDPKFWGQIALFMPNYKPIF